MDKLANAPLRSPDAGVARSPPPAHSMTTVLVVDPHEDSREVFGAALTHAGYRVVQAQDGEEGLARALAEHPAVVVLEYPLPVDGRPLVEVLHGRPEMAGSRILCVTARAIVEELTAIRRSGVDDLATKPLNLDDLCGRVRALCSPA